MKQNMVGWFEIPVSDMERAKNFYEAVFAIKIELQDFMGFQMGWFPDRGEERGATGTLVKQSSYVPSKEGTLIYFSCDDLKHELDKVEGAGGEIIQKKTQISPDYGNMAVFLDTEGNRMALHSMK